MIWHKKDSSCYRNCVHLGKGTMGEHIGIEFTEVENFRLYKKGTMPVDGRTRQPYGIVAWRGLLCTGRNTRTA